MFMVLSSWQSHCESSPGSFDERRTVPRGRRPKTKPDDLGCESACTGCLHLHPPSPFIIITQPESWYSFYRPTESRRLSRPSWLVTYRPRWFTRLQTVTHPAPMIRVLTGSDVAQLRWSRPSGANSLNNASACNLLLRIWNFYVLENIENIRYIKSIIFFYIFDILIFSKISW